MAGDMPVTLKRRSPQGRLRWWARKLRTADDPLTILACSIALEAMADEIAAGKWQDEGITPGGGVCRN